MYRTSAFLKKTYITCFDRNQKSQLFVNSKKYFYGYFSKGSKYTTVHDHERRVHVRTRSYKNKEEKKIKLKEKFKLLIFSSLYLLTVDYLYHVYILKDTPEYKKEKCENEQSSKNIETDGNKSSCHELVKKDSKDALMQYFRKSDKTKNNSNSNNCNSNSSSSNSNENENSCNNRNNNSSSNKFDDDDKTRNKNKWKGNNLSKQEKFLEKELPKNNQTINNEKISENETEVKINRINNKRSMDIMGIEQDLFDRLSRDWWNSGFFNNEKEEQEHDKKKKNIYSKSLHNNNNNNKNSNDILPVRDLYYQQFFNGCNLFLMANGIVFLGWRLSEILRNKKLYHFMCRHFICSYENIKKKYYHTFLTASISHISFPHFLFNTYAFYVISNTLLSPEIKENKKKYFFLNYKSNIVEKKITDKDIITVCALSSLSSTFFYVLLHKGNQVLGASGSIMGLIYILSTVKPNEVFISIFPFPYLKLTSLQLCHITILTNFLFLFWKRNLFNVAWSAHLFGFLGGAVYNMYQRKKKNSSYYPFWELSLTNGKIDYFNSYADFLDFLKCFQLKMQILFTLDHAKERNINKKITAIKFAQMQRKIRCNEQKKKNMDAMSSRLMSKE